MNPVDSKVSNTGRAALTGNDLRGVLLPFTTPFDSSGRFDAAALRANLKLWALTAIKGYAALGSTGERFHLDEREYREVIETARAEVPAWPDGPAFIVGAGQQSTVGTIREIEDATTAGADAVLVITPFFYRSAITQEALVIHYTEVADASPVPVILYSMPPLTGVKIEPETVARLSRHPNIIGVKESSADIKKFRETVELVEAASAPTQKNDFAVLTGNGTVLHDALRAGARGAILAVGCVVPEICLEIYDAHVAGDRQRAAILQDSLTPLATAVTTRYGIGGLKVAMDMNGYRGGSVRAPLRSPDGRSREEIAHLLNAAQGAFKEHALKTA